MANLGWRKNGSPTDEPDPEIFVERAGNDVTFCADAVSVARVLAMIAVGMVVLVVEPRSLPEKCHSTAANDLQASASLSAQKNPHRIPTNTPPVFSRLRPRIYQQLLCLATKDYSDRLLARTTAVEDKSYRPVVQQFDLHMRGKDPGFHGSTLASQLCHDLLV